MSYHQPLSATSGGPGTVTFGSCKQPRPGLPNGFSRVRKKSNGKRKKLSVRAKFLMKPLKPNAPLTVPNVLLLACMISNYGCAISCAAG